jgi:hypothetical protein
MIVVGIIDFVLGLCRVFMCWSTPFTEFYATTHRHRLAMIWDGDYQNRNGQERMLENTRTRYRDGNHRKRNWRCRTPACRRKRLPRYMLRRCNNEWLLLEGPTVARYGKVLVDRQEKMYFLLSNWLLGRRWRAKQICQTGEQYAESKTSS